MDAECTLKVGETCTITLAWAAGQVIDAVAPIDLAPGLMFGVILGAGAWSVGYMCGYVDGRKMFDPPWRMWRRKAAKR